MNPQALIELPGYGEANKVVKAHAAWNVTMTDQERIEWLADNVISMTRDDDDAVWSFKVSAADYAGSDIMRLDLDNAATNQAAKYNRAYLEV